MKVSKTKVPKLIYYAYSYSCPSKSFISRNNLKKSVKQNRLDKINKYI